MLGDNDMKVYIYRASILCFKCGESIIEHLPVDKEGNLLVDAEDENVYPQGPYHNGGGISDRPQHCNNCNTFLENPLTPEGETHIKYMLSLPLKNISTISNVTTRKVWREYYSYLLDERKIMPS